MACPTLPNLSHEARIDAIEAGLRHALGHPPRGAGRKQRLEREESPRDALFSSALIEQLRASVGAMSAAGAALGAVPAGYPLWATLVIRSVSALLPWYTRSLRAFARAVSDTAVTAAAVIEDAERRAREAGR